MFIGLRSSYSIIEWMVVEPQSSCSAIGWIVVIGLVSNWPVMGWTVVSRGWINTGGRGWINTGGIRGEVVAEVVTVEAVVEVIAAIVWFIGC